MKDLILIGAGGFGSEVAWIVERINEVSPQWNLLGFVDDYADKKSKIIDTYSILGTIDDLSNYPSAHVVCCIANTTVRKSIIEKVNNPFATLIDPAAIVSNRANIGEGSVVCPGVVITVDIIIGKHNIIDANSTVGHGTVVGDCVTAYRSANISGNTKIESGVQIGTGAQILQGLTVGANTFVGAGAVVTKNLPEDCVAVGVPARIK